MKRFAIATALALAALTLRSQAQDPSASPAPGGPPHGGPGQRGEHQRPDPAQMAAKLMEQFDANKDGELSQDELTKALEFLRSHRPPHPPGDGGPNAGPGKDKDAGADKKDGGPGGQGGPGGDAQRPSPPPADQMAAHMIEKFSSDKTGLKVDELAKALAERFAHHGPPGGGPGDGGPGADGPGGKPAPSGSPADSGSSSQ